LPDRLRDAITDWLQQCVVLEWNVYRPAAPMIAELIERAGSAQVVDLCSGAGGPWPALKSELEALAGPVSLQLTDKFPNHSALEHTTQSIADGRTSFRLDSVDARDVPADVQGVRTLFTAIHHLRPEQASGVFSDAFSQRVPIGAFDFCGREQVRPTLRMNILPMLKSMRRVRPRRRLTMFLTYVIPVVPLLILWDATISNMRAYTPEELDALVSDLSAPDWEWRTGRVESTGQPVTFIVGYPLS